MPPNPKHQSLRARRNKPATSKELVVRDEPREVPDLPPRFTIVKSKDENGEEVRTRVPAEWHDMAIKLWTEIWESPMAEEFHDSDIGEMERLLALTHRFWETFEGGSNTGLALMSAEIKQLRKAYGLNPMARRSLDWTIAQTEEARSKTRRPRKVDVEQGEATDIPEAETVPELPPSAPAEDPTAVLYE